jgi:uncharacterized membrane protein
VGEPIASLYQWLMLVHIVAAMAWVGGILALGALALGVARCGDAAAVAAFVSSLRVVGPLVLAPAPLLVVGAGIWMVLDDEESSFLLHPTHSRQPAWHRRRSSGS